MVLEFFVCFFVVGSFGLVNAEVFCFRGMYCFFLGKRCLDVMGDILSSQ